MSYPPFFVSEPNLTPSRKKLGCAPNERKYLPLSQKKLGFVLGEVF